MNQPAVTCRIEDGIARLRLDDGKANAINLAFIEALDGALSQAEAAQAAILIEGRPGFFSGGLDLKSLPFLEPPALRHVLAEFGRVMMRLFGFPRPVVARASGHAIAGGAVVLLTADERYQSRGAYRNGLNETALGIALPRFIIEMARAQLPAWALHPMIAGGGLFSPDEALRMHLFNEVGDEASMEARALERVKALAALPAEAYRVNKLALRGDALAAGKAAYAAELEAFAVYFAAMKR
ncbi:MAG: enoyl-CoA hydratase-related protein [Myxococcota bacterium]